VLCVALVVLALGAVPSAAGASGDAAAGEAVYKAQKCSMCHQVAGQGGKMGGSLDGVGSKHDAEWLRKFTKDPKAVDPKAKMKAYPALTDKELDDLVAYLLTLKAAAAQK
jgi:cytochrome c2